MNNSTATIDEVLESIEHLNNEDKEYVFDILSKRIIDNRQKELIRSVKEADDDYEKGNIRRGTFKETWHYLND